VSRGVHGYWFSIASVVDTTTLVFLKIDIIHSHKQEFNNNNNNSWPPLFCYVCAFAICDSTHTHTHTHTLAALLSPIFPSRSLAPHLPYGTKLSDHSFSINRKRERKKNSNCAKNQAQMMHANTQAGHRVLSKIETGSNKRGII